MCPKRKSQTRARKKARDKKGRFIRVVKKSQTKRRHPKRSRPKRARKTRVFRKFSRKLPQRSRPTHRPASQYRSLHQRRKPPRSSARSVFRVSREEKPLTTREGLPVHLTKDILTFTRPRKTKKSNVPHPRALRKHFQGFKREQGSGGYLTKYRYTSVVEGVRREQWATILPRTQVDLDPDDYWGSVEYFWQLLNEGYLSASDTGHFTIDTVEMEHTR